ncbi:hypothetical protein NDU88_005725 [Pleurodeles waltl]|uniref:Uncharacterized protein n=1 Tax=Pleurodeles waltl TaxID=8319 RepID=A0AAV7NNM4_PLEWA|nr:hypothetical protein NDU88_005725 [Pleurodeles waltl]
MVGDAEGRSRHNNLFNRVPEASRGVRHGGNCGALDSRGFEARWTVPIVCDRKCALCTGDPPRPRASRAITARTLNYKAKDCILWVSREMESVYFDNHRISIYPEHLIHAAVSRPAEGSPWRQVSFFRYTGRFMEMARGMGQGTPGKSKIQEEGGPGPPGGPSTRTGGLKGQPGNRSCR